MSMVESTRKVLLGAAAASLWLLLTGNSLAAEEAAAPTQGEEKAAEEKEGGAGDPWDYKHWKAGNSVANTASLQRGARNFTNYCLGCHSLKYMRYARMAQDLAIPDKQLHDYLIPTGDKPTDYIMSNFPAGDGVTFFGKPPPDLSLIARSKGPNYIYQFLKTFYLDPSKPTGTNNLALDGAAMPAVLSELEGTKRAIFHEGAAGGEGGGKLLAGFEQVAPGHLNNEEFDGFVRDTVNFLDYVGEPAQLQRTHMGVWVVLFLLVFTWFAWLLKREYWKDVH
jgi:ubiquinol-cytochrome c reductase cytochrome c1 subunit